MTRPAAPVDRPRSRAVATWLALVGGSVGLHRFYLHGRRDVWACSMPPASTVIEERMTLASASSDALGQIGIVRQRQGAMHALANEVRAGRLTLHPGADVPSTLKALQALPGIGDWTAQYIAMRALRWPDAFPAGDVALQKAMGVATARAAAEASLVWRPWRSYAVLRAWYTPPVSATAAHRTSRQTDDKDTP